MDKGLDRVQAGFGQGFGKGLGQRCEQGSCKGLGKDSQIHKTLLVLPQDDKCLSHNTLMLEEPITQQYMGV